MVEEYCDFSRIPSDLWPVERRTQVLSGMILPAVIAGSGGLVTNRDFTGQVLDVACGRGALGPWARKMGASHLVGIDLYDYGSTGLPTAYECYDRIIVSSVQEGIDALPEYDFDLMIAICTHMDAYTYMAQHRHDLPLVPGGKLLLISDVGFEGPAFEGMIRRVGEVYQYSVGIWQKTNL